MARTCVFILIACFSHVSLSLTLKSRKVQKVTESVPESPPSWASLVINLDRRPDRLKVFTVALAEQAPWLLKRSSMCRISGRDGHELLNAAEQQHLHFHLGAANHSHNGSYNYSHNGSYNYSHNDPNETIDEKPSVDSSARFVAKYAHNDPNETIDEEPSVDSSARFVANYAASYSKGNITSGPLPHVMRDPSSLVADGWITEAAMYQAVNGTDGWPAMTAGGIGLYLAHADAWQQIIKMKLDYGIIFEDDLTLFAPSFESHVSSVLAKHDQVVNNSWSWDLLYLQRDNKAWPKRRASQNVPKDEPRIPMGVYLADPVVVPIDPGEVVPCTGAYILTRQGAEKLLSNSFPMHDQLDWQLGNVPGLRRASFSPPVAQCWEIYRDRNGERHRDTDVQQREIVGNSNPKHLIRDEDTDQLMPEVSYWAKKNQELDEWKRQYDIRHGRHGLQLLSTKGVTIEVADCEQRGSAPKRMRPL